jgi:fructan beta-fructosidase
LPIALYPPRFGDWCFSGSAVVDWDNTAGFKTGQDAVIVAAYTSTGRGECIAYSNDCGRTFTDYPGNPVVRHTGRDPKIIWYKPGRHWVMAVYDEQDKSQGIAFYTSADLRQWERTSRIEGFFECPELFELSVDGRADNPKWVLHAGDGNYRIGRFDGKTFVPESPKHTWSWGNCFYASQTFNDIPQEDGRRIQMAWGRIATPGMPFNQCMLFPCELTLRTTDQGIRMFAQPAREVERLHGRKQAWTDTTLRPGDNPLAGVRGDLFHIRARLSAGDAREVGFVIRGIPLVYRPGARELTCQDKTAPLAPVSGEIQLEMLVDRTSIEIFGNQGRIYMPMGVIPPDDNKSLEIYARGGLARILSLEVYPMRSIWE